MLYVFSFILAVSGPPNLTIEGCDDVAALRDHLAAQSFDQGTSVAIACDGQTAVLKLSRPSYRPSAKTLTTTAPLQVAEAAADMANNLVFDIPPDGPRLPPAPQAWNSHGAQTLGKRHHGFRIGLSGGFDTLLMSVMGNDFRYSYGVSENLDLSVGLRIDFFLFYAPLPSIFSPEIAGRYKLIDSGKTTLALGFDTRVSVNALGGGSGWLATPALLFSYRFARHWSFDLGVLFGVAFGRMPSPGFERRALALLPGARVGVSYFSNAKIGFFIQAEVQAHLAVKTAADPIVYDGAQTASAPVSVFAIPRAALSFGPQWRW